MSQESLQAVQAEFTALDGDRDGYVQVCYEPAALQDEDGAKLSGNLRGPVCEVCLHDADRPSRYLPDDTTRSPTECSYSMEAPIFLG